MMIDRTVIVVLGMMGQTPYAGVAWQVLHYLEGFRGLGYEVYYVEDTGDWPYDPIQNTVTDDCRYTTAYLARIMDWWGEPHRWAYRSSADGEVYGMGEPRLTELFRQAGILVNLSGATVLRPHHLQVPVRIYLETDPVLPQIEVAQNRTFTIDLLSAHTHHFTFGENLGAADCGVPIGRFHYYPTRQPIVLDWWAGPSSRPHEGAFTTIGNWRQMGKDVEWNGDTYFWSKHHEFLKCLDLPRHTKQRLEVALSQVDAEAIDLLTSHGWTVVDGARLSIDMNPYRDYIQGSRGEFTVAKDQNIRLRSGWFSDRSACYLAAGKPVITQDTGFGAILPTGEGLFSFGALSDAQAALETINADYHRHSSAARRIAETYFRAETVLRDMMDTVGASPWARSAI